MFNPQLISVTPTRHGDSLAGAESTGSDEVNQQENRGWPWAPAPWESEAGLARGAGAVLSPTSERSRGQGGTWALGQTSHLISGRGGGSAGARRLLSACPHPHFPLVRFRSDLHPPQSPSEARLAWDLTKPLRAGGERRRSSVWMKSACPGTDSDKPVRPVKTHKGPRVEFCL